MGKILLLHATPFQMAWLRYTSAFFALLLILQKKAFLPIRSLNRVEFLSLMGLGLITFGLSPLMQASGLAKSQAVDNAILIAVEPVLTVAIASILLRERIHFKQGVVFLLAGVGFYFFADLGALFQSTGQTTVRDLGREIGNIVLLISLLGEAFHSSLSSKLIKRFSAETATASGLAVGTVFLTLTLELFGPGLRSLVELAQRVYLSGDLAKFLMALLWMGPLGTALTYWMWVTVLKRLPVSGMVVSLFVQPLVGVAAGVFFLGEILGPTQILGAIILLSALVFQVVVQLRAGRQ